MINQKEGRVTPGSPYKPTGGEAKRMKVNKDRMESEHFAECCNRAGIKATRRQASKFNNEKGQAYRHR